MTSDYVLIYEKREKVMQYSALIVAAGSGTRMKLGYNKVYAKQVVNLFHSGVTNMESTKNNIGIITESCATTWRKKSVITRISFPQLYRHHQMSHFKN